jgi:hypothetical protein
MIVTVLHELLEKPQRLLGLQRLHPEPAEVVTVRHQLIWLLVEVPTNTVLHEDAARVVVELRRGRQDRERSLGPEMGARDQREYLDLDVRPPSHLDEVLQLLTEDCRAADRPTQCRLSDHNPEQGRALSVEYRMLTADAQVDELLHAGRVEIRAANADQLLGSGAGLQQAGHDVGSPALDLHRAGLQTEEQVEVGRHVAADVAGPPVATTLGL